MIDSGPDCVCSPFLSLSSQMSRFFSRPLIAAACSWIGLEMLEIVAAENLTNRRGNRIEYFVLPVLIVLLVQIGAHMNNRGRIVYYHYPA
jgi:hypothetical protein